MNTPSFEVREARYAFAVGLFLGVCLTMIAANAFAHARFNHDCRALGGRPETAPIWSPICFTKHGPIYATPFWRWPS